MESYPSPHTSTRSLKFFESGTLCWVDSKGVNTEGRIVAKGLFCSYGCRRSPIDGIKPINLLIGMILHLRVDVCPDDYISELRSRIPYGTFIRDLDEIVVEYVSFKLKHPVVTFGDMILLTNLLGGDSTAGYRASGEWYGILCSQIRPDLQYYFEQDANKVKERFERASSKQDLLQSLRLFGPYGLVDWVQDNVFFIGDTKFVSKYIETYVKSTGDGEDDLRDLGLQLKKIHEKEIVIDWAIPIIQRLLGR